MDIRELTTLIRAGYDDRAIEVARASGPPAFNQAQPLLADASPQVRAIALRVLDAADPQRAHPVAVKALSDPSDEVKTFAVAVLRPNPPSGAASELLAAYNTANDPALRGEVALLAGRVEPPEAIDTWRAVWVREDDRFAKADVCKALARMGDQPARDAYVASMKRERGRPVFDLIRGTAYFNDTWIVPALGQMLDRKDVALHLAADFPDTHPFRVCDVALEAILKLTGEKVEFQVPRPTQYTEAEIAIVRAIARKFGV
ncbi:MAG: hypothetical protein DYG94_10515 [Leptolyngbya sp. PLA3]|nr:MAG: hypothetical protein EDM82_09080 [Cyanobacteria bacterium CYA]MCE7969164.1 hypothetical protein [Leptolyngbya sp. PL-A3]